MAKADDYLVDFAKRFQKVHVEVHVRVRVAGPGGQKIEQKKKQKG